MSRLCGTWHPPIRGGVGNRTILISVGTEPSTTRPGMCSIRSFSSRLPCPHGLCPVPRPPSGPFRPPPPPEPDTNRELASCTRKREGAVSPSAPSSTTAECVAKTILPLNAPEMPNRPPLLRAHAQSHSQLVPTPIDANRLARYLTGYDRSLTQEILHGFMFGFPIHHQGPRHSRVSHNHPSALAQPDLVSSIIQQELEHCRISGPFTSPPFRNFISSPLGLVPKKDNSYRLIHDLSFPKDRSVNDSIPHEFCRVSYQDFDHAVNIITRLGKNCLIAKADIESAFRIIPISPKDYPLLGFQWQGKYYHDRALPMGCSVSCRTFELVSSALEWVLRSKFHVPYMAHILDDFMFFGERGMSTCQSSLQHFFTLAAMINLPIKTSKTVLPTTKPIIYGIQVDTTTMQASLPQDKLHGARSLLSSMRRRRSVTLRELQSLLGILNFACRVIQPGRAFLRRLIDLTTGVSSPQHHIRLTKDARQDMTAWLTFLDHFNGTSLLLPSQWNHAPDLHLHTDASGAMGMAAVFGSRWFQCRWPQCWMEHTITVKELLPIVLAVDLWASDLANKRILLHCDNQAVVFVINKQTSKEPDVMQLLRRLVCTQLTHNILLRAKHIPGAHNVIADALSRFQNSTARTLAPELDARPVSIPQHLLPWHT